jgi:hypothetical protein
MDEVHTGYIFEWVAILLSYIDYQSSHTMCGCITTNEIKWYLLTYLSIPPTHFCGFARIGAMGNIESLNYDLHCDEL